MEKSVDELNLGELMQAFLATHYGWKLVQPREGEIPAVALAHMILNWDFDNFPPAASTLEFITNGKLDKHITRFFPTKVIEATLSGTELEQQNARATNIVAYGNRRRAIQLRIVKLVRTNSEGTSELLREIIVFPPSKEEITKREAERKAATEKEARRVAAAEEERKKREVERKAAAEKEATEKAAAATTQAPKTLEEQKKIEEERKRKAEEEERKRKEEEERKRKEEETKKQTAAPAKKAAATQAPETEEERKKREEEGKRKAEEAKKAAATQAPETEEERKKRDEERKRKEEEERKKIEEAERRIAALLTEGIEMQRRAEEERKAEKERIDIEFAKAKADVEEAKRKMTAATIAAQEKDREKRTTREAAAAKEAAAKEAAATQAPETEEERKKREDEEQKKREEAAVEKKEEERKEKKEPPVVTPPKPIPIPEGAPAVTPPKKTAVPPGPGIKQEDVAIEGGGTLSVIDEFVAAAQASVAKLNKYGATTYKDKFGNGAIGEYMEKTLALKQRILGILELRAGIAEKKYATYADIAALYDAYRHIVTVAMLTDVGSVGDILYTKLKNAIESVTKTPKTELPDLYAALQGATQMPKPLATTGHDDTNKFFAAATKMFTAIVDGIPKPSAAPAAKIGTHIGEESRIVDVGDVIPVMFNY